MKKKLYFLSLFGFIFFIGFYVYSAARGSGTYTPNLRLYKPADQEEEGWGADSSTNSLNVNADLIEDRFTNPVSTNLVVGPTPRGLIQPSVITSSGALIIQSTSSLATFNLFQIRDWDGVNILSIEQNGGMVSDSATVTGPFNVRGPLSSSSTLTIDGLSTVGRVQATSITVSGPLNSVGPLSSSSTLTIDGLSTMGRVQATSITVSGPLNSVGPLSSSSTLTINSNAGIGGSPNASYGLDVSYTTGGSSILRVRNSGSGAAAVRVQTDDATSAIGSETNHPLQILQNNTTRAFISTDGNFAIGTTTGTQKLHVYSGNAKIDGNVQVAVSSTTAKCSLNTSHGICPGGYSELFDGGAVVFCIFCEP